MTLFSIHYELNHQKLQYCLAIRKLFIFTKKFQNRYFEESFYSLLTYNLEVDGKWKVYPNSRFQDFSLIWPERIYKMFKLRYSLIYQV